MVLYEGEKSMDDADGGGSIGDEDIYKEKVEPILVSPSDSYSELDSISVCVSRSSSSPALHFLLTTSSTNCCPKKRVNSFGLRRLFYSKQDLKDAYCFSM